MIAIGSRGQGCDLASLGVHEVKLFSSLQGYLAVSGMVVVLVLEGRVRYGRMNGCVRGVL